MDDFELGNDIVRVSNFRSWAPKGYKTKVLKGYKYRDKDGCLFGISDNHWELAEEETKPATAIHEGNIYELNKEYLFGDGGSRWVTGVLKSINCESSYPFRSGSKWKLIKTLDPAEFGTITPVPVKLDDGAAYMFDYMISDNEIAGVSGIYDEGSNRFYYQGGGFMCIDQCTNIRPLTLAEVKS